MKVIKSYNPIYVDVDDTLIFWPINYSQPFEDCIQFTDPRDGEVLFGLPNKKLISKLRKHKMYGKQSIIVWSNSGWEWAKHAVEILGLEGIVDVILTKPGIYYDDKKVNEQHFKWNKIEPPEGFY